MIAAFQSNPIKSYLIKMFSLEVIEKTWHEIIIFTSTLLSQPTSWLLSLV